MHGIHYLKSWFLFPFSCHTTQGSHRYGFRHLENVGSCPWPKNEIFPECSQTPLTWNLCDAGAKPSAVAGFARTSINPRCLDSIRVKTTGLLKTFPEIWHSLTMLRRFAGTKIQMKILVHIPKLLLSVCTSCFLQTKTFTHGNRYKTFLHEILMWSGIFMHRFVRGACCIRWRGSRAVGACRSLTTSVPATQHQDLSRVHASRSTDIIFAWWLISWAFSAHFFLVFETLFFFAYLRMLGVLFTKQTKNNWVDIHHKSFIASLQEAPYVESKKLRNGSEILVGYCVEITREMARFFNFR